MPQDSTALAVSPHAARADSPQTSGDSHGQPGAKANPWRLRRWVGLALLPFFVATGYEFCRVFLGSNVHTVVPKRIYRTAQPSPEELTDLVKRHGIRTVINLRGCGNPFDWYMDECRVTHSFEISQEDLNFSANRIPSATELRRLVEVLDHAEYPVLIHCRRGADRTGMATAIALMLHSDLPFTESRRQLGLRFGHVRFARTRVLDEFFDGYEAWLREAGKTHSCTMFRHWILHEYDAGCAYRLEEFTPLESHARTGHPAAFRVRLVNTGKRAWNIRAGVYAGMHLGFQIFTASNELLVEGRAGKLDRVVHPGESWEVTLVLPPIAKAGRYRLLVDMVEENRCWFFQAGAQPLEQELVVRE